MKIVSIVIVVLLFVLYLVGSFLEFLDEENERDRILNEINRMTAKMNEFKVSDYLSRIEKEALDIQRRKEHTPKEHLTLWWGLDGLRLNEDGIAEWIRREEKKSEPPGHSFPAAQNMFQSNMIGQTANAAQILAFQMQMQNCRIQQQQMIQAQQMVNAMHPPYIQSQYQYYQNAATQCCARLF